MTGDSDDFLDIKQAAKLLNVSETSLRRWTNSGALMAYRIGRRRERRFRRSDLFAFIAAPSGNAKDGREQHITKGASESSPAQSTRNHGNHFCGAYGSEASAARLAAAFLADDDSRDVVKFLLAAPKLRARVLKLLHARSSPMSGLPRGESLVADVYRDSAKAQIDYWRKSFDSALARGATSLRVAADTRDFTARTSFATLIQYEADYERLIAQRYPVATLCLYDARLLSGRDTLHMLKAHGDTFRRGVETLFD